MNALLAVIVRAIENPHTSIAGAGFLACKLGAIWLPQWQSQFNATEGVFVAYGLFKAADAKAPADAPVVPAPPKQP